jgi:hypothetical protein
MISTIESAASHARQARTSDFKQSPTRIHADAGTREKTFALSFHFKGNGMIIEANVGKGKGGIEG